MRSGERGEGLVDAVAGAAIVSIAVAAVTSAVIASTHWLASNDRTNALRNLAASETRVALDVLKYEGGSVPPAVIATTVPVSGASPIAVHLSIVTTANPDGSRTIAVSASDDATSTSETVSVRSAVPAPLPSATIDAAARGASPL